MGGLIDWSLVSKGLLAELGLMAGELVSGKDHISKQEIDIKINLGVTLDPITTPALQS